MNRVEIVRAKALSKEIIGHVNRYNAGCLIGLKPAKAEDEGNTPQLSYSCLCWLANNTTNNEFGFQCRHISGDLANIQMLANRIGVPNLAVMVIVDKEGAPGSEYLTPFKKLHPSCDEWELSDDELVHQGQKQVLECHDWARFFKEIDEILEAAQD